jgi:hypothetical protein
MNNDYQENPEMVDAIFTTPNGHKIAWSTLLLIKSEIFLATNEEVTLPTILKIADFYYTALESTK